MPQGAEAQQGRNWEPLVTSGQGKEERVEWGPAGVGSSLLPDAITSALALATLVWWLHCLPEGLPVICSVPRGLRDLSKLKSDVSPYFPISCGNYNNALPWPIRAPHEPALAHLWCPLLSSLLAPYSQGSAQMSPSLTTLPKWPLPQPYPLM